MEIEIIKEFYDDEKTIIYSEYYCMQGEPEMWHREDGPAVIKYYRNGKISYHSYWVNDKCHREDGPARTWYDKDGYKTREQFWLHGCKLTEKEFKMKQRLKGTLLEDKY